MANRRNKISVAIFYDGNYIGRLSKYYASNNIVNYRLNIDVLNRYIKQEVATIASDTLSEIFIASSHYYRNRHSAPQAIHRKNQLFRDRIIDDILRTENIESHYSPYTNSSNKRDDSYICSWLSCDLLEEAIIKDFDLVVLVAGDGDYIPVVRKLQARGVEVLVVGWDLEMCTENGIDVKADEQLLSIANHSIVVNQALDENPEQLSDLLTAVANRNIEQPKPQIKPSENQTVSEDDEREVSEVVTLKPNFGFIRFPNNNLFFRSQDYIGNFSELQVGDTVEFTVDYNDDGQNSARKVTIVTSNLAAFDDDDELYKIDESFFDWSDLK